MIGNIYINGAIGFWEGEPSVQLTDIIKQVKEQPDAASYNVYINSEGGYVDVGFDILNYLRSLGKPITTIGNGIVASIATVIFMAGTTRQVKEGTQFMIHLPWGERVGNADDMELYAKELRSYEKQLIDFYKKELGLEEEAIQPLLRDETWLTPEQLSTLGFTTAQPFQVAAKASINIKKVNKMTEEDKSWFEKQFSAFAKKFKTKPANKLVQDATGAEIDFTDLADDAAVEVGAMATVNGQPAEGEYTLPDGTVYVFAAGALTEIRPPASDDLAAANARIAELEAEVETLTAAKDTAETQITDLSKEFNKLKTQVMSKFSVDPKKEPKTDPKPDSTNRFAGAAERVKNLKK